MGIEAHGLESLFLLLVVEKAKEVGDDAFVVEGDREGAIGQFVSVLHQEDLLTIEEVELMVVL